MAGKFKPPYYAVIFTTKASAENEGYEDMAARMLELAQQQDSFELHIARVESYRSYHR